MSNPRIQCDVCGKWTRLDGVDAEGFAVQHIYPDATGRQWCERCIESKPKEYEEACELTLKGGKDE